MNSAPKAEERGRKVTSQGGGTRSARVLSPGTILENRYEIQRVAGRGGMSTVYAARDLRFGQVERMCAIKEMGDSEPDPGTRALSLVNFEREAALLATIAHPAVPKIYDYFAHDGMIYLVLEFVDGQDLERTLFARKAPFPEEDIVRWGIETCDVLEMLHNFDPSPIIFRDLKPSNIMLRSSGKVALIDFGIARTFQGSQRGTMIGTEGYAPPEQYRGMADARGDIYALGATLHHMATNSDPRQQTPFTFHERAIQSLNPSISIAFADIVMRMLAYHPDQRYQCVADVRFELENVANQTERRHSISTPRSPGGAKEIEVNPSLEPAAGQLDRRRPSRKRSVRRRNTEDVLSERFLWSTATADEVRGTACYDGESVFIGSYDRHVYCLAPEDGAVRWKFPTGRGVVARPVSHNGLVFVGSEDSAVYCLDARSGGIVWQYRTSMPVRSSAVGHENRVVVGSDDSTIYCFDLTEGEILWRQRTWGPIRSSPVIHENRVFVGGDDGYVYALDLGDGGIIWRRQGGGPVQSEPYVTGSVVLSSSRSGNVVAFDRETGERAWQYMASGAVISSPRVQNGTVIFGVADGGLVCLNQDDGSVCWVQRYANQITSTPLLGKIAGYIGTIDGACVSFAIDTGEMIWKHELGGSVVSSPVYAGSALVVGSTDGRVHGLALATWEHTGLSGEKSEK